jgi:serine/threonine-protein kinase
LRTLVQRCLTKDRRQRVSDIAAARFVLTELNEIDRPRPARAASDAASAAGRRSWLLPAGVAALVMAIVGSVVWARWPKPDVRPVVQFSFTLPDGQTFSNGGRQVLAISPDGTKLVFVSNQRLYLRAIGELEAHAIPGTESDNGGFNPVFSPNGQSIAFWSAGGSVGGTLKRIPVSGGAPSILANTGAPIGATWGSDGILFGVSAQIGGGAVARVAANGGPVERLITLGDGERAHGPQMLPDGRTVLFTFTKDSGLERWDRAQVVAESLIDHRRRVLVDGASDGRYLPSGHLLYAVRGTIYAVPFDLARLEKTGDAVPVIVGVRRAAAAQSGSAHLVVSENGVVMYRPGSANLSSAASSVMIGDQKGESTQVKLPVGNYAHPRVSPDGRELAVSREDGTGSDIWTYDLSGGSQAKRLTFEGHNRYPVWSADGRRVTFQSSREGDNGIWWQSPETGAAERLTRSAKDEEHVPDSWSHDGTRLLFSVVKGRTRTLWVLTLNGLKVERFSSVESVEPFSAGFSPDGKWVVYAHAPPGSSLYSPERGVFVEPYPTRPGEKRQAPKTNIDYHPQWSADGKNIYYVPSASRPLVAVPITLTPAVSFGTPVELPRLPRPALLSGNVRGYDVLHDGRAVSLSPDAEDLAQTTEVRVILNWFDELRRLAPAQ